MCWSRAQVARPGSWKTIIDHVILSPSASLRINSAKNLHYRKARLSPALRFAWQIVQVQVSSGFELERLNPPRNGGH